MATRAERFKAATARNGKASRATAGQKTTKTKKRIPSRAKLMSNAMPKDERRYGGYSTGARNKKPNPSEATYEFEDNRAPQPPSRKSTRKSSEHVKLATALTSRQKLKLNSPHHKHDRRGV